MKNLKCFIIKLFVGIGLLLNLSACRVVEQSSQHGFNSGYYLNASKEPDREKVYLDISEDTVTVYSIKENNIDKPQQVIPFTQTGSEVDVAAKFYKSSLDIDVTSILFKYRPTTHDIPSQLSTDLNIALYAGWRQDTYRIVGNTDALGRTCNKVINRGYDFGFLAGTGSTVIGPATTNNKVNYEYNGMILEIGFAAFIEASFASFGLATGFDHLLNSDRNNWIYNKKPWLRAGKELRVLLGHKSYGQVTKIPDYLLATFIALVGEEHQRGRELRIFGPCWCYSPTRIRAGKELRVLLGHKSYGQVTKIPDYLLATFIALVGEEHQRGRRAQPDDRGCQPGACLPKAGHPNQTFLSLIQVLSVDSKRCLYLPLL
jgi:hypothetical protein